MKIVRFLKDKNDPRSDRIGVELDEGILDLSTAFQMQGVPADDILSLLRQGQFHPGIFQQTIEFVEEQGLMARLCVPEPIQRLLLYRPPKIIALGLNYTAHAAESGFEPPEEPVIFTQANTCVIGPGDPIQIKKKWGRIDPEVELAVIIGVTAKDVPEEDASDYIAGYSILNDVTARAMQQADFAKTAPWFRSKSMDTFGPFGPCIVTPDELASPVEVDLELSVNGQVRQRDNTRNLIFGISQLIAHVSDMMTLEPGDIISTGTPEGVAEIVDGDEVTCRVEGIGVLRNPVVTIDE